MNVQKNWYIINISKSTWRKWCKANRWVFQTFWTMKLKKGIALSSANRLGWWRTNNVHSIVLTDCNDNLLRQVKYSDFDARCPANKALGAVHAQMEHYLHYIVDYQYFCTVIESFLLAQLQYTSCICSEWRCRNQCAKKLIHH